MLHNFCQIRWRNMCKLARSCSVDVVDLRSNIERQILNQLQVRPAGSDLRHCTTGAGPSESHRQIEFNETADLLAKETAHDIYTGSLSAPSVVSYSDAVKISASIASKSWQTKWERDTSGFYTRHLIPE